MTTIWCKGHLLVAVHFKPTNYIGWIWKTTFQQCNHWLSSQVNFYCQVPLICIFLEQHWCDHLAERHKALLILRKHKSITSGWRSSTCWGEVDEAFFEGDFSIIICAAFEVSSWKCTDSLTPHSKHTQCRSVVACSLLVSDSQETWGLSPSKCPRRQRHFSQTTENPNIFRENNRCWFIWEFKDQPPSSILTKPHGSNRNHCNLLHASSQTLLCTEFTTAKGCTFSWFLTHCLVRFEKDVVQNIKHMFVWRDLWLPENLRGVFWWPSAHFSSSSLWRWIWVKLAGKFCSLSPYS